MAFTNQRSTVKRRKDSSNIMLLVALAFIVVLVAALYFWQKQGKQKETPANNTIALNRLEIPAPGKGEVVQHAGFTLAYNEEAEQAAWVAYVLTGDQIRAVNVPRTNRFLIDPNVSTQTATDDDYQGTGYDRGHLAPAEDMSYSTTTMTESFYYSNMSPQVPAFNRGVWKRLEELVRFWATEYDSIYIVTGPVLQNGLPTIGKNKVAVPQTYYKVILHYSQKGVKGIGFLLTNEASAATLKSFAVSIDQVEQATGIDFYPKLPDDQEELIESKLDIASWQWTRRRKE